MTSSNPPQRGEVWLVNFDPTLGTEIQKIRPAVVISSNEVGTLPIKLVGPITDWLDEIASITIAIITVIEAEI
jgi:mRNA interferase MazF